MLIAIIIGLVIIFGTAAAAIYGAGRKFDQSRNKNRNKKNDD